MSTPATDQTNLQIATLGALEWSYTTTATIKRDEDGRKSGDDDFDSTAAEYRKTDNAGKVSGQSGFITAEAEFRPGIKSDSAGLHDLVKHTDDHIIVRVQRDPNTTLPTRAIKDAGPIWLASAFTIPKPLTSPRDAADRPEGSPADSTAPPYTRNFGTETVEGKVVAKTFADWLLDGNNLGTRAKTARCWTFEEAVEAGARLASALTDS